MIVDAVGVCEGDRTESQPLDRDPALPFASAALRRHILEVKAAAEQILDELNERLVA